jgi:DNA-binding NarL/FixJ family response regulator
MAALIPGSVLIERDYGVGRRARADWDEHIGSRFRDVSKPATAVPDGLLTEQEHKVVALIAEGRTNAQIAEALTIAESTAARHVHNVLTKLGVSNRVEAAAWWLERRR